MVRDSVGKVSAAGLSGVVTDTVQEAGEGDSLKRRNCTGPNLTYQILKKAERIIQKFIRQEVENDEMQFGFVLRCREILRKKKENCVFCICRFAESFWLSA